MLTLLGLLRRHRPVLLACSNAPKARHLVERARALGIETVAFNWRHRSTSSRFAAWLANRNIDLCHVHAGICWEAQSIAGIAKRAGVAVVVRTEHLPYVADDPAESVRYAAAMLEVDQIICVSREARDSFLAFAPAPERIAIVRNGIPARPRDSDRMALRAKLGFDEKTTIVLTVARYTEQKDYHTLADAIPAVIARAPYARFVWVGTGPLEREMLDVVQQRGLGGHVMFLGQREDVPDLMQAADAFALPSRFEGMPLAVLEAMATALPVIGTRVCGTAEAVKHGVTGLLVEPGRVAALSAALIEVVTRPDWAATLGRRGQARAQRWFSAERMKRETLAVYDEVWNRRRQTSSAFRPPEKHLAL